MQLDTRTLSVARHLARRPIGHLTAEIFTDATGDQRIAFNGGRWGSTSLSLDPAVTSTERLLSHWEGYAEANGVNPVTTPGSAYWWHGNGNRGNARAILVLKRGARGAVWYQRLYANGNWGKPYSRTPRSAS